MVVLHRALRRVVLPFPLPVDPTTIAAGTGLLVIGLLATADSIAGRDGFTVVQRFAFPAAALAVWIGIFQMARTGRAEWSTPRQPAWPAVGGFVLFASSSAFIAIQSSGEPWGAVAISAASYLSLFGAAALRRQSGGWGLTLLIIVQVVAAAVAFLLVSGPQATVAAALLSLAAVTFLLCCQRLSPQPLAPLDELAALVAALRAQVLPVLLASLASILLALMIGGQTSGLTRLLVPLTGLAASRLVAEEVFLRLWLLPRMEQWCGATFALVAAAGLSAALACLIRPTSLSPWAAAAVGFSAALAAGVLARRTRNGPAVILFRLLVG